MAKTMEELRRCNQIIKKRVLEDLRAPNNYKDRKICFSSSPSLGGSMSELLKRFSNENCLDDEDRDL